MTMRAAIYLRVSTKPQDAEDKTSLEIQNERCRALCAARGWDVVETFRQTTSGTKWNRLKPMLAAAAEQRFDVVVFFKIDRFARNLRDMLNAEHDLAQHDVCIASVTDNFDTASATGRAMFQMMGTFAELEGNVIHERLHGGLVAKLKSGKMYRASSAPYGYTYNAETQQLDVDDATAAIVRRIYNEYLTGAGGTPRIASALTRDGIPAPFKSDGAAKRRGTVWHATAIYNILTSPTYRGEGRYTTGGTTISMPCPAIIRTGDWNRVQKFIKARGIGPRAERDYMLSRRLYCACGGHLSPFSRNGNLYYKCNRRTRAAENEGIKAEHAGRRWTFAAALLEEPVKDFIRQFMNDPATLAGHVKSRVDDVAKEMDERMSEVTPLRDDVKRLAAEEARLLDEALAYGFTKEAVTAKLTDLRTAQATATKRLAVAETATLDIADIEAELRSFAGELADVLSPDQLGLSADGRRLWTEPTTDSGWRQIVFRLFDRIEVSAPSGKKSKVTFRYDGVIVSSSSSSSVSDHTLAWAA